MYHTKKIGVFISHIMGNYQTNVCQGIIDKAVEYGYTVEIFASMDGENLGEYGQGEQTILNLPNYEDLSGVIFVSGTYPLPELKEQLYHTLKTRCACPIVEIEVQNPQFPSIVLENHTPFFSLAEHFIREHHCRNICYFGCSDEKYFSDQRAHYYKEALNKYGLTPSACSVFSGTYSLDSAKEALAFFRSEGETPDAVLCYNDRLALLFMRAALEAGFRIPEDIALSGCDCSEEGQNTIPALTSVSYPVYELGTAAVQKLVALIHRKPDEPATKIRAHMVIANSCGCHCVQNKNAIFYEQKQRKHIDSLEAAIFSSMRMSAAFQNAADIDEGMEILENYVYSIEHCREFYLCLYAGWDSVSQHILDITEHNNADESNTDEVLLKLAIRDKKRLPECSYTKNSLLPEYIYKQSDSAYLYFPLFFKKKEFGYIALSYENNQIAYHFQLLHWFMNINQLLKRLSDAKKTSLLVSHLEELYTKDTLTGLYNEHGYLYYESLLLADAMQQNISLTRIIFTLRHLPEINDRYGYEEGDFAIQVVSHALLSTMQPSDVCARISGGEFYLLTKSREKKDAEKQAARVCKYLDNYNKLSHKKYNISVTVQTDTHYGGTP